jgi:hypothetical protein
MAEMDGYFKGGRHMVRGALDRGAYERERGKREVNNFSERRTLRIRI